MLTAKRPFGGETVTDALAAVVKEDPDWTALPRRRRPRCGACSRSASSRIRSSACATSATRASRSSGSPRVRPTDARRRRSSPAPRRTLAESSHRGAGWRRWPAAGLAALAWWLFAGPRRRLQPLARFVASAAGRGAAAARERHRRGRSRPTARDRLRRAAGVADPAPALFRRRLECARRRAASRTPKAAYAPFFSPDGKWIGFFTDKSVMKLAVDGGGVSKICDRGPFSRADWAPERHDRPRHQPGAGPRAARQGVRIDGEHPTAADETQRKGNAPSTSARPARRAARLFTGG